MAPSDDQSANLTGAPVKVQLYRYEVNKPVGSFIIVLWQ